MLIIRKEPTSDSIGVRWQGRNMNKALRCTCSQVGKNFYWCSCLQCYRWEKQHMKMSTVRCMLML